MQDNMSNQASFSRLRHVYEQKLQDRNRIRARPIPSILQNVNENILIEENNEDGSSRNNDS